MVTMIKPSQVPILIVDDDPVFRTALKIVLERPVNEWLVLEAGSVAEALAQCAARAPDLAIVDIHLPDGTAADIIRRAGTMPCLLCTQDTNEPTFSRLFNDESVAQNLVGYLVKPLSEGAIFSVRAALQVAYERQLRSRLVAAATSNLEDERRVIAQNMHDGLGALLTQLRWVFSGITQAAQAPDRQAQDNGRILELCNEGKQLLAQTHQEINNAITQLRPDELSVVGLRGAIDYMVSQWARIAKAVTLEVSIGEEIDSIDARRAGMLYRIVQEGLTNAMRHSNPTHVLLALDCISRDVRLMINTAGRIDTLQESYALTILRERTSALGGQLQFSVDSSRGTSALMVLIPK